MGDTHKTATVPGAITQEASCFVHEWVSAILSWVHLRPAVLNATPAQGHHHAADDGEDMTPMKRFG